jgi:cytochrome c biogenesis protein CcmG/thiol:disulfide interchange protein DsbE|tara:strand:- start:2188 stop:2703 length:516 start_codon:yes stop_codon:yes gene_type:complete
MKKIKLIILILSFNIISVYCQDDKSLGKIPNIDLKLLNGKKTTLYKLLKTGPVLIDFWATWCKPCQQVMKHLNNYHNDYKSEGFTVVMINQDTPRSLGKVKAYVNSKGYDFLVSIDPNQQISKKLNGQIMPNLILVNQDATVKWRHQGYMPGEELEIKKQIESLLLSSKTD